MGFVRLWESVIGDNARFIPHERLEPHLSARKEADQELWKVS